MGTREAAERLGKSQQGIRYLIDARILRATKVGRDWRIPVSEVEKYEVRHRA